MLETSRHKSEEKSLHSLQRVAKAHITSLHWEHKVCVIFYELFSLRWQLTQERRAEVSIASDEGDDEVEGGVEAINRKRSKVGDQTQKWGLTQERVMEDGEGEQPLSSPKMIELTGSGSAGRCRAMT